MSKYGIDYYNAAYYGSGTLSQFNATPFTAVPKDYGRIYLSWTTPSGQWDYIRVVRSSYGFPVTVDNGDMLFEDAFIEGDLSIKSQILMYCYVHFYTDYPKAKVDLMKLIKDGIQCLGCDFSVNILRAKEKNHSEIDRVIEFAKRLTQSSPSLFDNQQLGRSL